MLVVKLEELVEAMADMVVAVIFLREVHRAHREF